MQSGGTDGHGFRIPHLLSRDLASVVTAEPAAHQSGMYRYGWGLVAAGGPGHEKAIRRRRRTTFSGPFRGALSGPQSRMTRCCAPAGLVAACPNAPARRVERAERAGVLVGRGSGRPRARRSGSAWPVGPPRPRWSTGCWPRCPGGRRYGAKVTSVRRRWVILLVAATAAAGCTGGGSRAPSTAPTSPPAPASTITWTDCRLPSDPGALVRAVAAGGDGMPWTAVGQEGGTGSSDPVRPAAWTSPDGCAWRRATVAPVTPDGQRTGFSLVARRGRLVAALGRSYSQIHGNIRPTLWRSDAGAPLREVKLLRELFGGGRGITMDGLVATPQAFLATGATSGRTTTWPCTSGAAPTARTGFGCRPAARSPAPRPSNCCRGTSRPAPRARSSWAS